MGQVTIVHAGRRVLFLIADLTARLLEKYQLTNVQLRDDRYNAVAHLVTAANGAEKFYTVNT